MDTQVSNPDLYFNRANVSAGSDAGLAHSGLLAWVRSCSNRCTSSTRTTSWRWTATARRSSSTQPWTVRAAGRVSRAACDHLHRPHCAPPPCPVLSMPVPVPVPPFPALAQIEAIVRYVRKVARAVASKVGRIMHASPALRLC